MVDRPEGPEPGTPEYDWLYGSRRKPADPSDSEATQIIPSGGAPQSASPPPGQEPEPTRVMPSAQQPYQAPPPPGQGRPQSQPGRPVAPPPGHQPPPDGGSGSRRRRFHPVRWLLLLVVLWLVFLIATPFFAFSKISTVDAFPDGDRPGDQDGTTYLIVGSDSRKDLSEEERKELGTGGDVGQRTDTIMLLHIGKGPNLLMSIPRDSLVEIPGHGTTKVNAAYAFDGPQLLVETIEQNTGIRIDHYVEIGLGGFVDVVDAVGGIEICPKADMKDKLANLDVKKGCQDADGKTALGYARSRHTSNLGDIDRARNQREVVSAVGDKAVSPWSVVNPVRYWKLNMAAARTVSVSEGTGPIDLGRFAWAMTRVNGEDGLTCGVPIADLAVHWDAERSEQMFQHIIDDDTEGISNSLCTESGLPE